jgi:hypothetical protein
MWDICRLRASVSYSCVKGLTMRKITFLDSYWLSLTNLPRISMNCFRHRLFKIRKAQTPKLSSKKTKRKSWQLTSSLKRLLMSFLIIMWDFRKKSATSCALEPSKAYTILSRERQIDKLIYRLSSLITSTCLEPWLTFWSTILIRTMPSLICRSQSSPTNRQFCTFFPISNWSKILLPKNTVLLAPFRECTSVCWSLGTKISFHILQ